MNRLLLLLLLATAHAAADEKDRLKNIDVFEFEVDGKTKQSYWSNPRGIDLGEPSRARYALHVLVGHHGIFSLTPVWTLSLFGALAWLVARVRAPARRELAALTVALTIICLVFFIGLRPQRDRNYGGMTNGFRWLFWLTPLWLLALLPAADWLGRWRLGRAIASTMLVFSALSVAYATWNPWTQPWLFRWLELVGWDAA